MRDWIVKDERFEVMNEVNLGLVCFRLKRSDSLNERFIKKINDTRKVHLTPSTLHGKYSIRFCVTHEHAAEEHIRFGWDLIKKCADEIWEEPDELPVNHSTESELEGGSGIPSKRMKKDDRFHHRLTYTLPKHSKQSLSDFAVPILNHHKKQ